MSIEITRHGTRWYSGSRGQITCPECNTNQVKVRKWPTVDETFVEMECESCGCLFKLVRDKE